MKLPYDNVKDLCVDFRNAFYGDDSDKKLRVLPYNRFDADSVKNWWWLSPTNEIPANKHGKFLFCMNGDDFFAGIHVEKGLSEGVNISGSRYNGMGMDKTWQWHAFIDAMLSGELSAILDTVKKDADSNPIVHISYFNVLMESITKEYEFKYVGNSEIIPEKGNWDKIADCSNIKELAGTLVDIGKDENIYFDTTIGTTFGMKDAEGVEWTLVDLHDNLMQHLEKWVN